MKNRFKIIVLIFLSLSVTIKAEQDSAWIAKIDGKKINIEEFKTRFEFFLKAKYLQQTELIEQALTNYQEKQNCLDDMINEQIMYQEAVKLKIDKRNDVKKLIDLYAKQIIINTYIEENLIDEISVTEQEINDFYEEHKEKYQHLDPDMANKKIRVYIQMLKFDKMVSIEINRLKEKYKIIRNKDKLQTLQIDKKELKILKSLPIKNNSPGKEDKQ